MLQPLRLLGDQASAATGQPSDNGDGTDSGTNYPVVSSSGTGTDFISQYGWYIAGGLGFIIIYFLFFHKKKK